MPRVFRHALLALALTACASGAASDDISAYPRLLAGTWTNGAQYAAAPADMKHAPAGPEDDWLDRVGVMFTPVSTAAAPVAALAEWRDGDGKVLGRGVWAFRRDGAAIKLDLYELHGGSTTAFAASDLASKGASCALTVTAVGAGAFNAQTDADACISDGAHLDIRITAMPTGILYQELRRSDDGAFVSRTPGGVPYDLRRAP